MSLEPNVFTEKPVFLQDLNEPFLAIKKKRDREINRKKELTFSTNLFLKKRERKWVLNNLIEVEVP